MSCHRYHLDGPVSDEEFEKLMAEVLGEQPDPLGGNRPLDEVFASRSHVRVLRVLSLLGDEVNLTGRDIARQTEISHTRVQDVLRELVTSRLVTRYRQATWAVYEIDDRSPLGGMIRALFESERDLTPA